MELPFEIKEIPTNRKKIGKHSIHLRSISSTNTFLLKQIELLKIDGLTVVADTQTAGRGRMQREWHGGKQKQSHLFTSIVIHPKMKTGLTPVLTLFVGLAVFRSLKPMVEKGLSIKWPNDILIQGKKVCGILCEMKPVNGQNYVVAGIGLNLLGDLKQYPEDLQYKLTTLEYATGTKVKRDDMLEMILDQLDQILLESQDTNGDRLIQEWEESSSSLGKEITFEYNKEKQSGIILGLNGEGNLKALLTESKKTILLNSGEVFFPGKKEEKE